MLSPFAGAGAVLLDRLAGTEDGRGGMAARLVAGDSGEETFLEMLDCVLWLGLDGMASGVLAAGRALR